MTKAKNAESTNRIISTKIEPIDGTGKVRDGLRSTTPNLTLL